MNVGAFGELSAVGMGPGMGPGMGSGTGTGKALNPDAFIRELTKPSVGVESLFLARNKVQSLADETNASLKRNVYKNYALFIETAKEISFLKNEMYHLSHLMTEEQGLLTSLLETSISGDRTHGLTATEKKEVAAKFRINPENPVDTRLPSGMPKSQSVQVLSAVPTASSKELNAVLEKVEGCSGIFETRNRFMLQFGELVELDPNDYQKVPNQGKTLAVLLNDCLLLASSFPFVSRLGKKYKFQSLYELDSIAVVNVKDANFKKAFKVLMFPQTKVFEVDSEETKKKWLEAFDLAKKQRRASLSLQRRDSSHMFSSLSIDGGAGGGGGPGAGTVSGSKAMSPMDRPYSGLMNPFEEAELMEDVSESDAEMFPIWLLELPEDMDVLIAQRNFEDAVALVHKVNDHFAVYPKCCDNIMQTDLKLRINHKIKELVDSITNELQISPDRSLQSGPRSARRAVQLLLRLGKSSLATKMFLAQRTALLKFCLRQQMMEGATLQYIKRMASVFFNNVIETCKEFEKAFRVNSGEHNASTPVSSLVADTLSVTSEKPGGGPGVPSASSAFAMACLVSWTQKQLIYFLSIFSRNVFTPQVSSSVAAECVAIVRTHCKRLRNGLGLELVFYLDKQLKSDIQRIISECRDKLLEAIKLRKSEDKWHPQNFGNKAGMSKFLEEMRESGLTCVQNFVFDEYKVSLTFNTTSFAKTYLNTLFDLLKLSNSCTHPIIVDALVVMFRAQMKHIEKSLRSDQFRKESKFIARNASFLLDTLLSLAEQLYSEKVGSQCKELDDLHSTFGHLKNESFEEPTRRRSPSKTTVSITQGKTFSTTTFL